jgi:hypothetical protein
LRGAGGVAACAACAADAQAQANSAAHSQARHADGAGVLAAKLIGTSMLLVSGVVKTKRPTP